MRVLPLSGKFGRMPVALDVSRRIRVELARKDKKRADLARALGISQQAMSRRMSGEVPFNVQELASAAEFLGVPVTVLLEEA